MIPSCLRAQKDKIILSLVAQPGAKRTTIVGVHAGLLKVKVAAPPVDGAANAALIEFLARALSIPKRHVCLLRGATSRSKVFEIQGVSLDQAAQALAPPQAEPGQE